MMTKCQIEKVARTIATESHLAYGRSIFDGRWYVGTVAECRAAGCPTIIEPKQINDTIPCPPPEGCK